MWLVSYGFKFASQPLSNVTFVHTYARNLKTTYRSYTVSILNNYSAIRDIPCMVYDCKRDLTGDLLFQTRFGHSLIQNCMCTAVYCKPIYTLLFGEQLRMTTKLMYCHTTHQTTALLMIMHRFIGTKWASYTTCCNFFRLIVYAILKLLSATTVVLYEFAAKQQKRA